jgi:phage terminase small subunit
MPGINELDEKQTLFLTYYLDPKSKTFSNAMGSALRAGYAESYAHALCSLKPEWFADAVGRRKRILEKAEKRLEELVETRNEKVAADVVKHVTKTLGKEFYSEKSEVEHSGTINIEISQEIADKNHLLNETSPDTSDSSEGHA